VIGTVVVVVVVVGVVLETVEMRRGIALFDDAARYLGAARSIIAGHGLISPDHPIGHPAYTLEGPAFPNALAIGHLFGMDPQSFARVLDAGFAAALAVCGAILVFRATSSWIAGVAGAAVAGISYDILGNAVGVGTDELALSALLVACIALTLNARPKLHHVVAAASALVVAGLTRFAGLAGAPAGLWIVGWSPAPVGERIRNGTVLVVAGAAASLIGSSGRPDALTFQIGDGIRAALGVRRSWPVHQLHFIPVVGPVLGALLLLLPAAAVVVAVLPPHVALPAFLDRFPTLRRPEARMLGALAVSHLALLLVATTLFDPLVANGPRIALPASVSALLLLAMAATDLARSLPAAAVRRFTIPAAAIGLTIVVGSSTYEAVTGANQRSQIGYSAPAWARARADARWVDGLPRSYQVVTDAPGLVYLYSRRTALWIPTRVNPDIGVTDPSYDSEEVQAVALLEQPDTVLVSIPAAASTDPPGLLVRSAHLQEEYQAPGLTVWSSTPLPSQ